MMFRMFISLLSLFVIPATVLMIPPGAQANLVSPDEVAHMNAGHIKVEGMVSEVKSGFYTVKTSTGNTYTLTKSASVRHGHGVPNVGDAMTLWINEGNVVMDVSITGRAGQSPRFISGTLASIDTGQSQMTLSTSGGERDFTLRPESRTFRDIVAGAHVTIEVNEAGEAIDIHKDKK